MGRIHLEKTPVATSNKRETSLQHKRPEARPSTSGTRPPTSGTRPSTSGTAPLRKVIGQQPKARPQPGPRPARPITRPIEANVAPPRPARPIARPIGANTVPPRPATSATPRPTTPDMTWKTEPPPPMVSPLHPTPPRKGDRSIFDSPEKEPPVPYSPTKPQINNPTGQPRQTIADLGISVIPGPSYTPTPKHIPGKLERRRQKRMAKQLAFWDRPNNKGEQTYRQDFRNIPWKPSHFEDTETEKGCQTWQ